MASSAEVGRAVKSEASLERLYVRHLHLESMILVEELAVPFAH